MITVMAKYFGKITHLEDPTIGRIPVRGFCRYREFHIPFWSMIYVALMFTLSAREMEFEFQ